MRTIMTTMLLCAAACLLLVGCETETSDTTGTTPANTESTETTTAKPAEGTEEPAAEDELPTLTVTSTAFEHGQPIPKKYTCAADDISPPLAWSEGPEGTQTYALIIEDPDAPNGNWVHWIVWNLKKTSIDENASKRNLLSNQIGAMFQGNNSWNSPLYKGPCPPTGTHRYFFRVYALDTKLKITKGLDKETLMAAMRDHVLAYGELMGTFQQQ